MFELDKFKGNKIIKLKRTDDDQYPFGFGYSKAKLILDNLDAIKDFVANNKKE
jgi:hypothetical protein